MNRQVVSGKELISILNNELSKFGECDGCRYNNDIARLRGTDPEGCNWSSVTLRCSGISSDHCKPISKKIVCDARPKYNLIDKPYIEHRVQDWIRRINNLYSIVKATLGSMKEIEFSETKKVSMYEELMQKYNVPPVNLPVLEIRNKKRLIDSFKPIGLWVIGANGRIDILTKRGAYILVDISEKQSPSIWKVYTPENRKKSVYFDEKFIKSLV